MTQSVGRKQKVSPKRRRRLPLQARTGAPGPTPSLFESSSSGARSQELFLPTAKISNSQLQGKTMERAPAPPGWELRRGCAAEPRLCTWAEPRKRPPRDSEPGRRLSTLGPPARSPELGKRGRCGGAVGPTQPAALGACRGFPRGGRTLRERAAGETRLQIAQRGRGGSERGFAPPPRRRRACTRGSRRRRELSVDARVHKPTPASPLQPPGAATQTAPLTRLLQRWCRPGSE